jgi:ubiquinone biosynthesis protein
MGKPFAQKVLSQKLNPAKNIQGMSNWMEDVLGLLKDLPYDAGIIMREIRKGRIKIEFEHVGLEPLRKTLNSMTNIQSITNIIVALLISSSVVVLAKIPPFVGSIPLLSFIGYILAVVLGVILFFSIVLRRDRK